MVFHWCGYLVKVSNVGLHLVDGTIENGLGVGKLSGHHVDEVLEAKLVFVEEAVCLMKQIFGMMFMIEDGDVVDSFLLVCIMIVLVMACRHFFSRIVHGEAIDINVIRLICASITSQ